MNLDMNDPPKLAGAYVVGVLFFLFVEMKNIL